MKREDARSSLEPLSQTRSAEGSRISKALLIVPFIVLILFVLDSIDIMTDRHSDHDPWGDRQLREEKKIAKRKYFLSDFGTEAENRFVLLEEESARRAKLSDRVLSRIRAIINDSNDPSRSRQQNRSDGEIINIKHLLKQLSSSSSGQGSGVLSLVRDTTEIKSEEENQRDRLQFQKDFGPFSALGKYGRVNLRIKHALDMLAFTQNEIRGLYKLSLVEPTMPFGDRLIELGESTANAESRRLLDEKGDLLTVSPRRSAGLGRSSAFSSQQTSREEEEEIRSNDASIFISIAAYRDEYCEPTVASVYDSARFPERVFVGIVRQQEDADSYRCLGPNFFTKRSDLEVANGVPFCQLSAFCPTDNIRFRFNRPEESKGPTYGRYVSMLMYQGENFAMIVDSHTLFALRWDVLMIRDVWVARFSGTPSSASSNSSSFGQDGPSVSLPFAVEGAETGLLERLRGDPHAPYLQHAGGGKGAIISHYPPSIQGFGDRQREAVSNSRMLTVMCNANYLHDTQTRGLIRMIGSPSFVQKDDHGHLAPRLQPFTAAGFLFGDASYLLDVPFDPYLDFLFDGEEILYTARLWTHGYDSYTPSNGLVGHIYGRPKAHRVWSVQNNLWWKHQSNAHIRLHYILRSYKYDLKKADINQDNRPVRDRSHVLDALKKREARRAFFAAYREKNREQNRQRRLASLSTAADDEKQIDVLAVNETDVTVVGDDHLLVISRSDLVRSNKDHHIERYGMGPYRTLDDFYHFSLLDRVAKKNGQEHCGTKINNYFDGPGYARMKLTQSAAGKK